MSSKPLLQRPTKWVYHMSHNFLTCVTQITGLMCHSVNFMDHFTFQFMAYCKISTKRSVSGLKEEGGIYYIHCLGAGTKISPLWGYFSPIETLGVFLLGQVRLLGIVWYVPSFPTFPNSR